MIDESEDSLPPAKVALLLKKAPQLLNKVKVSPSFWAILEKYDVLSHSRVEDITNQGTAAEVDQVNDLVGHLVEGKATWYRAFLQTLVETGQGHIVTQVLGEELPDKAPQDTGQVQLNDDSSLSSDKVRLLRQKSPALKKHVKVTAEFWDALKESSGPSWMKFTIHQCTQDGNTSEEGHIISLISDLKKGTHHMYHSFIQALLQTDQEDIVTKVLGQRLPEPIEKPAPSKVYLDKLLTQEKEQILIDKGPELIQGIKPTDELLASLMKYCVISEEDGQNIMTGRGSDEEKTTELLDQVRRGTVGHYDGFVKALLEANQAAVVTELLGEDAAVHKVTYKEPKLTDTTLVEAVRGLKQQLCERCRTYLHEFSTVSQHVDLQDVYTPLHITHLTHSLGDEGTKITEDEIFKKDEDDTCWLTLCVGHVGSGKTTLAMRLAQLWAQHDQHNTYFWSRIKAVILLESTCEDTDTDLHQTMPNNLRQIMRNAISGKKAYKDAILELFDTEPTSVLLIIEAFDRFNNKCVVKDIQKLLRDKAANVLLTIREGHPYLTGTFRSYFSQCVSVRGFTQEQAVLCASSLLKVLECGYEGPDLVKAVEWRPWFYTNPFNLNLACQMYSEGKVDMGKLDINTEAQLYKIRELRMVEREILRINGPKDEDNISVMSTSELQKIHSLALQMVNDNRSECTKADLESADIPDDSPLRVLLELRKVQTAKSGTQCGWCWPHRRLQEVDAALAVLSMDGVQQAEWLQQVDTQSHLRGVVEFVAALNEIEGISPNV